MLIPVRVALAFYCLLISSHYTPTNSDVAASNSPGVTVELNSYKRNDSNKHVIIGVIIEDHRFDDFIRASKLLQSTQVMANVTIVYHVVKNDPYDVLKTVCDNFTEVNGLVFVCEQPCSHISSFVSFIGLSGILVEKRSEDHTPLFMESPKSFLDIKPPLHLQNAALIDLMIEFQWKTFCLIHDMHPHTIHLVDDLQKTVIAKQDVQISRRIRLDGSNSTIDRGLRMAYGKIRVFVLFCTRDTAEIVLDRARAQQLTTTDHAWIAGEMVLDNRNHIPASFPIGLLGIEYDYKGRNVEHIVDAINTVHYGINKLVLNDVRWLTTPKGNCITGANTTFRVSPLYEAMSKLSFTGKTGNVAFTEDGFRAASRYNFVNLQQKRSNGKFVWQNVGYSENGNVMLEQIVWPGGVVRTPSGIPRVRLRVLMYEVAPMLYVRHLNASTEDCQQGMKCTLVTTDNKEEPRCCYGLCIDLLSHLSQDLDLEPEIRTIEKGRAGSLKNGQWTGIIGSVFRGEADMAISSISITEERSKYIDFSAPFVHTGSTILVAKKHGRFTGDGFLKPFQTEAWIFLFGVLYIVAFVVYIFESKNPGLQRTRHKNYAGKFDIHTSIWLIYSRLFSGNLDSHTPRFISSRVVLGSWSFSSLMVVALYTANLAAFMVQKAETHYIDGINDSKIQMPSNDLKFTTILDTSVGRFFKNNFPNIYRFMEKQHRVNSSKEGVQAVIDGKIDAFIWETVSLQKYTSNDVGCRLLTVGKPFDQTGYAAVFQKNSKWTKNVTEMILKYQTSSKSAEIEKKWQKGYCHQASSRFVIDKLLIYNLAGVFYLLLAGIGLSILVLIGENIFYSVYIRHQKKTSASTILSTDERLQLQKEVRGMEELLEHYEVTDNRVLLSKMEQELQRTLQDIQDLQEQTKLSFNSSTFQTNDVNLDSTKSNETVDELTLTDIKKIIEVMKKGNSSLQKESVV